MKILKKYSQYIKGTLPESELDDFTKEIVKEHFEKEELQNKWSQILQEQQDEKKPFLRSSKRIVRISLSAAASILLLIFSWFTYRSFSPSTYEKLLSQEFNSPYVESLSRKGHLEDLQLQAVASYNERNYASAEAYFEQLRKLDEAVDWDFYIGLCQLYQKNTASAIQSFNLILKQDNIQYEIEVNWYLGIAYIQNENFASAKKHLQFVAKQADNNRYWKVKEAKALLNAIAEEE